jgi:hypothetical protein
MLKRLILVTVLVVSAAHAAVDDVSSKMPVLTMDNKVKTEVWSPSIAKKESGKSCKDGNCFTKNNKMYRFFTSVRDKVKKECKKL